MEKKKLISIIVLTVLILFVGCTGNDEHGIRNYWNCMDGCYEMQYVYEAEFNISRDEARHHKCSERCWDYYDLGD